MKKFFPVPCTHRKGKVCLHNLTASKNDSVTGIEPSGHLVTLYSHPLEIIIKQLLVIWKKKSMFSPIHILLVEKTT